MIVTNGEEAAQWVAHKKRILQMMRESIEKRNEELQAQLDSMQEQMEWIDAELKRVNT